MKKLFVLSVLLGFIFLSCKKEIVQGVNPDNLLLSEQIGSNKVKLTSQGITLLTTFDEKTGEVSITQQNGVQTRIILTYRSYREKNGDYQMVSNYNNARYLNKFVVLAYSTIPVGVKYKVELNIRTSNGGTYDVTFDGKKK